MSKLVSLRKFPLMSVILAVAFACTLLVLSPARSFAQEAITSQESPNSTVTVTSTETVTPAVDLSLYPWMGSPNLLFLPSTSWMDSVHFGQSKDIEKWASFRNYDKVIVDRGGLKPSDVANFTGLNEVNTDKKVVMISGKGIADGTKKAVGDMEVISLPPLPFPWKTSYPEPTEVAAARKFAESLDGIEICLEADFPYNRYPLPVVETDTMTPRVWTKGALPMKETCGAIRGFVSQVEQTIAGKVLNGYIVVEHKKYYDFVTQSWSPFTMGPYVLVSVYRLKMDNYSQGMYVWSLISEVEKGMMEDAQKIAIQNPLPDYAVAPLDDGAAGQVAGEAFGMAGLYMVWKIIQEGGEMILAPAGSFIIVPIFCDPMDPATYFMCPAQQGKWY